MDADHRVCSRLHRKKVCAKGEPALGTSGVAVADFPPTAIGTSRASAAFESSSPSSTIFEGSVP